MPEALVWERSHCKPGLVRSALKSNNSCLLVINQTSSRLQEEIQLSDPNRLKRLDVKKVRCVRHLSDDAACCCDAVGRMEVKCSSSVLTWRISHSTFGATVAKCARHKRSSVSTQCSPVRMEFWASLQIQSNGNFSARKISDPKLAIAACGPDFCEAFDLHEVSFEVAAPNEPQISGFDAEFAASCCCIEG